MKCAIMVPSLLRSPRSYLFHIRFSDDTWQVSTTGRGEVGNVGDEDKFDSRLAGEPIGISSTSTVSSVSSSISCVQLGPESSISLDLVPKLSPNRLVVGVPVTIHLLSTLRSLEKGTKAVYKVADTWPSSMTRRFHLICKKGETPVV